MFKGEVRLNGNRMRVFTAHRVCGMLSVSIGSGVADGPIKPPRDGGETSGIVSAWTTQERWKHDLTQEQAQVELNKWRSRAVNDGFSVPYHFRSST